ncbi:MAG: hypothetical protein KC621_10055 [Myxococcales bacterium]|nr:hypothetical protein [Myxococcales bacterium]
MTRSIATFAALALTLIAATTTDASAMQTWCGTGERASHATGNFFGVYPYVLTEQEGFAGCCITEIDPTGATVCSEVNVPTEEECMAFNATCTCEPSDVSPGFWWSSLDHCAANMNCAGVKSCELL